MGDLSMTSVGGGNPITPVHTTQCGNGWYGAWCGARICWDESILSGGEQYSCTDREQEPAG